MAEGTDKQSYLVAYLSSLAFSWRQPKGVTDAKSNDTEK